MLIDAQTPTQTIVLTEKALAPQHIVRSASKCLLLNSFAVVCNNNVWASQECFIEVDSYSYIKMIDLVREEGCITIDAIESVKREGRGTKVRFLVDPSTAQTYTKEACGHLLKDSARRLEQEAILAQNLAAMARTMAENTIKAIF